MDGLQPRLFQLIFDTDGRGCGHRLLEIWEQVAAQPQFGSLGVNVE
jgi:hypothetical protein